MDKGYILVEGHGDEASVANLVQRLWSETSPSRGLVWASAVRWPSLHTRSGVHRGAAFARAKRAAALLIVRDENDACPKLRGPEMSSWLREEELPFPAAVVLLHPEFEVLFLPCLERM